MKELRHLLLGLSLLHIYDLAVRTVQVRIQLLDHTATWCCFKFGYCK